MRTFKHQKREAVINIANANIEKPSETVSFVLEHTYNLAITHILRHKPSYTKSDWLREAVREKLEKELG